jgi:DNA-binding Lrp family transcriptional regulator
MKANLDKVDNQILALLMDDARIPVTAIAKKIGMARTTVIARIASLENNGIIAGYGVRLNQNLFESGVRAYVGMSIEPKSAAALVRLLQQWPEVESMYAVSGAIDYMLTLRCTSTEKLDHLLDEIGDLEGVRQTSTSIILSKRIDRGALSNRMP